ncbi:MAG: hypothetical protein IT463_13270 [Planctomycetes bacterium]|nr:hypothetical protein [Planctomycetota bacterium]
MKRFVAAVALLAALGMPALADDDSTYKKIESQLESTTLDKVAYEEADVETVIKDIAQKARVTIVIDKKALEGVDEDDKKITLELADIKAMSALNIVIEQIKLHKSFKNGVLYITTEEKAEEASILKTYDVRDITAKVKDFPAPEIRLRGADDNDAGPIIEIPDEEKDVETDEIVEMIEDSVQADWGGKASVTIVKGSLLVRATRKVHKEVESLLNQLRSAK